MSLKLQFWSSSVSVLVQLQLSFILAAGPPGSGEDEGSAAADGGSDGAGCSSAQRSDFSFQKFYWVLPGFTAFYLVLLGFILVSC